MKIQGTKIRGLKLYSSAAVVDSDTYFNLVSLLLPGNGTNGAQNNTFVDSSTNAFTITRNGNTTQGTFSPFSQTGWSNYFDGTGDYITFPSASRSNLSAIANTQMTWEFWIYTTNIQDITAYDTGVFGNFSAVSANGRYAIGTSASGTAGPQNIYFQYTTSVSTLSTITTTQTLTLNSWNHIAITVDATTPASSTIKIFINGSGETFSSQDLSTHTTAPAIDFRLGEDLSGKQGLTGYISNFRVVRGSLVYTNNFTPPTAALTAITNTVVLTSQSNRFIDNSTNAYALTIAGNTAVQAFSPFDPTTAYAAGTVGGSGYFDGSGDYLTVADNTAFEFGSGDFTIEGWFYALSVASDTTIVSKWTATGTANSNSWLLFVTSGVATFLTSTNGSAVDVNISGGTVTVNSWNHIAVSRSGNTYSLYLNGTRTATTTNSNSLADVATVVAIGRYSGGTFGYMNGYISNARIVKGTAVYTGSTYTVPTAPVTAIANTQLLLNYTNAGIPDATAKGDWETVGNAQISTAQSKFGGSSMYFDGSGDRLINLASSQYSLFDFGTGNFTIEFWFYCINTTSGIVYARGASGHNLCVVYLGANATDRVSFYAAASGAGTAIQSAGTPAVSTWNHAAIVRQNGTVTVYLNGTGGTPTSNTTNITNSSYVPSIGDYNHSPLPFAGYIDDFRITKGYARYTTNFTPPTTAFPTQ